MHIMEKVVSLCKRRGFIFPGSEIYSGLGGFWDYGPLGVEMKRNVKRIWWQDMVEHRDDVVGLDAAIIMNPAVWEASGHTASFTDPLIECKRCHKRIRADQPLEKQLHEKEHDESVSWTDPRTFNLLTEVFLGVVEPKEKAYLRGEITQGVFVNFQNVVSSTRVKIPFGIAQIGKAFRNEITPGNFTFRSREFEQMELEYFIPPDASLAKKSFEEWKSRRMEWYVSLGLDRKNLRFRKHADSERAHYAREAEDIEYHAPFGWKEFEGIHHRGNWDLSRHRLSYVDPETGKTYVPWVIETSGGVDRALLFFLIDAYREEEKRVVLQLHPRIAPVTIAVFPLVSNKSAIVQKAREIYERLRLSFSVMWDDRGNIGKRYFSQDEIGTPWCLTVDYDTVKDGTVTVRDRDSMRQIRVSVVSLQEHFSSLLSS